MNAVQEWLQGVVIKRLFMSEAITCQQTVGNRVNVSYKLINTVDYHSGWSFDHHVINENTAIRNPIWKTKSDFKFNWKSTPALHIVSRLPLDITWKSLNYTKSFHKDKPHHIWTVFHLVTLQICIDQHFNNSTKASVDLLLHKDIKYIP